MPFVLIKGRYTPKLGTPDGDSVRFRADNLAHWHKLQGAPVAVTQTGATKGTAQLRLEGIDAVEKGAIKPPATDATANLKAIIGYDANTNPEPRGFILARMTDDRSRRPIAFAFAGEPADVSFTDGRTPADGDDDVFLDVPLLEQSVNYAQVAAGLAYPLYYNTLFADLRGGFNQALALGKQQPSGYLDQDATLTGVTINSAADLDDIPPIWPKLWRRLETYLRDHNSLGDFIDFLEEDDERIDVLSIMEERGLQDLVEVNGNTVGLIEPPENLRVVGKAGRRQR